MLVEVEVCPLVVGGLWRSSSCGWSSGSSSFPLAHKAVDERVARLGATFTSDFICDGHLRWPTELEEEFAEEWPAPTVETFALIA